MKHLRKSDRVTRLKIGLIGILLYTLVGCSTLNPFTKRFVADFGLEERLVKRTNQTRRQYRYPPLKVNEELRRFARNYSAWMMRENFFSHVDPDGNRLATRLKKAGIAFIVAAENLAKVKHLDAPEKQVFQAWMNNAEHRRNILSFASHPFPLTGVGVITDGNGNYAITQILIHPKN